MARRGHLSRAELWTATVDCTILGLACLATYLVTTRLLVHVYSASRADNLLGGLWAVVSTVFVFRDSYQRSVSAAVSRISATAWSFALCLIYLAVLPFQLWALAVLIGLSALGVTVIGRAEDAITAAITTTVVLIAAAISPQDAWRLPILRLADTVIGTVVGVAAAWAGLRLVRSGAGQAR
jgi:uncharacterized membrane protein YccC